MPFSKTDRPRTRSGVPALLAGLGIAIVLAPAPIAAVGEESLATPSRLTTDAGEDRSPDCSSDGATVVFSSDRHGSADLFILNLEDGVLERLTDDPGDELSPAWSPGDDRIVFQRIAGESDEAPNGLWILDRATGEQSLLLAEESSELTPDWSPDGDRVAFTSERNGLPDLYQVRADGSGLERLTEDPHRDIWPRYSPDGSTLVFFSRRDTRGGFDDLYLLDLASRETRCLTEHPDHHDFVPAWSPDGSRVVTGESRRAENRRELAVVDLEGTVERRLARDFHRVFHPTWCSDGSLVFAARLREGELADLYRVH